MTWMEVFCIRCLRTAERFREFPVSLLPRMRFRKYTLGGDADSCSNAIKYLASLHALNYFGRMNTPCFAEVPVRNARRISGCRRSSVFSFSVIWMCDFPPQKFVYPCRALVLLFFLPLLFTDTNSVTQKIFALTPRAPAHQKLAILCWGLQDVSQSTVSPAPAMLKKCCPLFNLAIPWLCVCSWKQQQWQTEPPSVSTAVLTCCWSYQCYGSLLSLFFNQFKDQVSINVRGEVAFQPRGYTAPHFTVSTCYLLTPWVFTPYEKDTSKTDSSTEKLCENIVQRSSIYPWFFCYIHLHLSKKHVSFSSVATRPWRQSIAPWCCFFLALCKPTRNIRRQHE